MTDIKKKSGESDPLRESDPVDPIRSREIGKRINTLISAVGGIKRASEISNVSDVSLYRYVNSQAKPTFEVVANLAISAGYSLEWVFTGEGPEKPFGAGYLLWGELDADTLMFCVEALETALQRSGRALTSAKKGEVLAVLYRFALEEKQTGKPPEEQAERILQLVKLAS